MTEPWDELPALTDPVEVLGILRMGDKLAHCHETGWRLVKADVAVERVAVDVLKRACLWFIKTEDGNVPFDFGGGCLAPLDDGLPGIGPSQTWVWAEGGSNAKH